MDNSLTIALASLGAVVLAGVIAHGAWSARRANPKRADPRPAAGGARAEPSMPAEPLEDGDARDADAFGEGSLAALAQDAGERRLNRRLSIRLDALIDSIATLRLEQPLPGHQIVGHLPPTRRAGGKPFAIEGLNDATGEWELPAAAERYRELQAGVQLANRTGALNEIEYSEFVQKVQAFAEEVGALADFPDMLDQVAAGRELDAFADAHDAQLAVHLRARTIAWSVGYIQQHAGRHGFLPGVVPGRLVMPGDVEGAPPVLTLTFDSQAALADDPNLAALRQVTVSFDVPQTAQALAPFETWQRASLALATELDAHLLDDHGRLLGPASFEAIGQELVRLYAALDGRDLSAGSPAARRLFS